MARVTRSAPSELGSIETHRTPDGRFPAGGNPSPRSWRLAVTVSVPRRRPVWEHSFRGALQNDDVDVVGGPAGRGVLVERVIHAVEDLGGIGPVMALEQRLE